MYKSAMLGCGGRARGHANAYRHVKGGKLAAICDMNKELLNKFGDDFDITSRYTDLDKMLEKEKPDVLHIVTAPVLRGSNERIRYPLMKQASDAGVPAAIVENRLLLKARTGNRSQDSPRKRKRSLSSIRNSTSTHKIWN